MDVSADEKQRIREKIEKLKQSKFKQQTLPAWRPVPTAMSTMMTFSIFSVVFLSIGIVLYVMSDQIVEIEKPYDKECITQREKKPKDAVDLNECIVDFKDIPTKINGPIYVYYQLDNFYQNHRRYVKSRDNQQLNGQYKTVEQLSSACDPIVKVRDLWENQQYSIKNQEAKPPQLGPEDKMDMELPAIPCGLVAKSYFNDTFALNHVITDKDGKQTKKEKKIFSKHIAWSSDLDFKFNNIKSDFPTGVTDYKEIQWMDMTNEHFIVWMRTAGLPNFRKLWGTIDGDLEPGMYQLVIQNNYQVAPFNGGKSFVLSTTNALGGKNYFLAVCYIVVGTLCLLFSFVFCFAYMKKKTNNS